MPQTRSVAQLDRLIDLFNTGTPFTAKQAARKLGTAPTSVRGRISELRNQFGYSVFTSTRRRNGRNIAVYSL